MPRKDDDHDDNSDDDDADIAIISPFPSVHRLALTNNLAISLVVIRTQNLNIRLI